MKFVFKQKTLIFLTLGGLLFLFTQTSCGDEIINDPCESGFVLTNGDCECPESHVIWQEKCKTLDDVLLEGDNSYLVELPEDCICIDKFTLTFGQYYDNNGIIVRNVIINTEDGGGFAGFAYYTEKDDGDEIIIDRTVDVECTKTGGSYSVKANGKFNSENTEMTLEWVWMKHENQGYYPVDTCVVTIRR